MAIYATLVQAREYMVGETTLTDGELLKIMARAERQVNGYLKWGVAPYTFIEWSAVALEVQNGLREAVCAQTEYRLLMGEEFFIETRTPVSGPDYSTTKAPARYAPKMREELLGSGLVSSTGSIGSSIRRRTHERRI